MTPKEIVDMMSINAEPMILDDFETLLCRVAENIIERRRRGSGVSLLQTWILPKFKLADSISSIVFG